MRSLPGYHPLVPLPPDDLFERWVARRHTESGETLALLRMPRADLAHQEALTARLVRDLAEVAGLTPEGFVGPATSARSRTRRAVSAS